MSQTTWRVELTYALGDNDETWADVLANTMTDAQMDTVFDDGHGVIEGCQFTVWTAQHVYFPCSHDGSESVGSVVRHPDGKPTKHIGDGDVSQKTCRDRGFSVSV